MILDCAVIGGGPAGLNASLVLGRAKLQTIVFDDNQARNNVTHASHGFITRDGIDPAAFKQAGLTDLAKYPNVEVKHQRIKTISRAKDVFLLETENNESFYSKRIVLATGLKDIMPAIHSITSFYGTSIFSCPFCDGWEMRDKRLVVLAEDERAFHMAKMVFNWSQDLIVCTNGKQVVSGEQKQILTKHGIDVIEQSISEMSGEDGYLRIIHFTNGGEIDRDGGIVMTGLQQASPLAEQLGCTLDHNGGVESDEFGRTAIPGVYAAGDMKLTGPSQLIMAASEGSKVAAAIVRDIVEEGFSK
ncbi:NAD(P)/FAD-dependent oxidoreductase [Gracilibacillus salinarum]|uniref:NAD(P)/FAD-dependent oxidoreductase n=1 Tax=Gracilibacillus salinarum TaxID=2932255 RepID=A0ABY4GQB0_9BACI|nr:NAD(P)/FAD-dependent oxidoreductase [Gracilibacillus salinarum]UOQ86591.1 NAD(P)/FAD-dependent oxidoreductase [Gracilibacillus salinarum]